MSYHLEKFYATNTILTNLHPDHLDWHRDLNEYYYSKFNLMGHTKETLIYPASVISTFPELPNFPLKSFVLPEHISLENGLLQISDESFLDLSDAQLFGSHNVRNIYCAALLALKFGITVKTLSSILPTIPALPHRLQCISNKDGKKWIDDSKSTTAQSLYAALRAFSGQKIHLIAGGKNKGDPFTELATHLHEYCSQCVVIGETKTVFLQACHEAFVPAVSVTTLEEAVGYMSEHTTEGDIILLSPGCASFDMFRDYEERAQHFVQAIHALK
jgi:UDP-N-acetylmuramoylalanine--D-glutamate ligase